MVGDTPEGHAQGDYLVDALLAQRDALGIDYILWRQRSISARTGWEWRPMASRGSRTLDHWDHPHVQTVPGDTGAALALGCVLGADPLGGSAVPRAVSEAGFIAPVAGPPGSGFGMRVHPITGERRIHTGLDFPAPTGTPILAVAPGLVEHAGPRGGYGNLVILNHGGGISTYYAHQSAVAVVEGQQVLQGQTIGTVGSTGTSTGPHLHFEVRIDGEPVDPEPFLPD